MLPLLFLHFCIIPTSLHAIVGLMVMCVYAPARGYCRTMAGIVPPSFDALYGNATYRRGEHNFNGTTGSDIQRYCLSDA